MVVVSLAGPEVLGGQWHSENQRQGGKGQKAVYDCVPVQ